MTILNCVSPPVDVVQVFDSISLCIYPPFSEASVLHTKQQAKLTYDNYKKDCLINQRYGVSYGSYMNNVISLLIDAQCEVDRSVTNSPNITPTLHKNQRNDSKVANLYDTSVSVASNKKCHTHSHRDINYPSKVRGYIATQPTKFKFIGPDRPGIDTKDSEQYLKLANTIT